MKFRRLVETPSLKELSAEQKPRRMGRLGQVVEGGGKSLLFAIGNYYLFDRYFASSVGSHWGYHGSWPTFALSHHILVWWCAKQVHPDPAWCTLYIVRGTR
ncbi:unnamed protein product [Brassica oleracea var. botrytis]